MRDVEGITVKAGNKESQQSKACGVLSALRAV